ncbi:hypothetical protein [Ketobacter sp.]|uniref:hypothetical protein n=1 Tax=Ketobacter sp. TaxID=2083498 RepID=UPI000F145230|nr:hypothetical protein [Ketobacter sp.]RLT99300.1 MAG: hypothetical protein D9N14_08570 [Ketobacter sp.]
MDFEAVITLMALGAISLMHVLHVPVARWLDRVWPNWSIAAGGFAVGYVFLLLLPKLTLLANKSMVQLPQAPMIGVSLLYLCVLAGFICFWIVDLLEEERKEVTGFWRRVQITSFFLYALLTGEMVVADPDFVPLAYGLAISALVFHLAGMNHLFHHWHPGYFQSRMRWLMVLGTVLGAAGAWLDVWNGKFNGFINAFMGGAILINVIYYELPRRGIRKIRPFLLGTLAFAATILCIRFLLGR